MNGGAKAVSPAGFLTLERADVERLLPHAPMWVMVDRVLKFRPSEFIRTERLIQLDDPFVAAHFSGLYAVYPGALLLEYASQSAYLLMRLSKGLSDTLVPVMVLARCNIHFISPARAGDTLTADVTQVDCVRGVIVCEAVVNCGQRIVCRTRIFAAPPASTENVGGIDGPGAL
jgi:3-hydroxyacyl-[acyl-carrier-protein] dehydratase